MRKAWSGVVTVGDGYRCFDGQMGKIFIGGDDIVDDIAEERWGPKARVFLNGGEIANGAAVTEIGWGYSEYTPIDYDVLSVGKCDILDILDEMEGQIATLVIDDFEGYQ